MRTRLLVLAISVASTVASPVSAAREVRGGPVPSWVLPIEAPLGVSSEGVDTSEGIHHLLLDVQVDAVNRPVTTWSHRAWRVLDETGVQNGSEIRISFDPSYERLVLHDVSVVRDGIRQPALDLARVRLIQREERLDAQIYDGTLTALYFIEGVQAGDVVEYAYTLQGMNPTFGERWAEGFEVQWSVPLVEHVHRVSVPLSSTLAWRAHGTALLPSIEVVGQARIYDWRQSRVEPVRVEADAPPWHEPWPWIQLSEWTSWAEVAAWGRELFEPVEALPAELTDLAAGWARETDDPSELARRALRFVQDEVRYLGIEFGPNAYRPSEPGRVYERRFGDCKDKSVLLVQLLRELGLEAHPALVSTHSGRVLSSRLPTPLAFDHAIVRLTLAGEDHWLDATRLHERGPIEELSVPEWGEALLLAPGDWGLVPVRARDRSWTRITETYECTDYSTPTVFTVRTVHEGADADAARAQFAGSSREELQRSYRDYYAGLWAGIESVRPVEIEDDEVANRFVSTETYRISDFWSEPDASGRRQAEVWNLVLDGQLLVPSAVERTAPLWVAHPKRIEQRTRLLLPEETSIEPRDLSVRDRAFRFDHRASARADGWVELLHRYETLRSTVEPADAAEYRRHVEQARSTLGLSLVSSPVAVETMLPGVEWPLLLAMLFAGLTAWLVAWTCSASRDEQSDGDGDAFAGWLGPFTALVVVAPVALLVRVLSHADAAWRSVWRGLTDERSPEWRAGAEAELLLELVGGAVLLALASVLVVRWLTRRRRAPLLCLVLAGGLVLLDLLTGLASLASEPQPAARALEVCGRFLIEGLLYALLLALLIRSERVKATFTA